MMGKPSQLEPKLFYHGISLDSRMPKSHPLRKIEQLVDFNFVRSRVHDLYGTRGNESVDPAVILKLMFLLFYENIKSERALMSQLPLRMDWLWFCGYDLDEKTPDHSVISKARRRWGLTVFSGFFENILTQCVDAGLVDGETIHVDSSMIDANASKDTLKCQFRAVSRNLYEELESNAGPIPEELERRISTTDPDARLGKKYGTTTLGYKDHRAVDDKCGIVTATVTTPANVNDEKVLAEVINEHQTNTETKVKTTVADKADHKTCRQCQYFEMCVTSKQSGRQIQRNLNQEYIDWADNCLTKHKRKQLMARRKHKAEGSFADAANNHGFKRSRFRGIGKVQIQNLMIAAIQNLRKLMRHISSSPAAQAYNPASTLRLLRELMAYRASLPSIMVFQR